MGSKKPPNSERFATPDEVVTAHRVIEEELGDNVDINFAGLPKNVGVKGDVRILGSSPIISTNSADKLQEIYSNPDHLALAANRICNETGSACRVFLDLTPDAGYFELDSSD